MTAVADRAVDAFAGVLGSGRGTGPGNPGHDTTTIPQFAAREYSDTSGMTVRVTDIAFHRNGCGTAHGFHTVRFDWSYAQTGEAGQEFVAVVFDPDERLENGEADFGVLAGACRASHEPRVAVLSTGRLPDVGDANKWRCDEFVLCLYQALADHTRPPS